LTWFNKDEQPPFGLDDAMILRKNLNSPLSDIYEDKDNYLVKMDLPGIKKEDVKISYVDNQLNISGEKKHEKESVLKEIMESTSEHLLFLT